MRATNVGHRMLQPGLQPLWRMMTCCLILPLALCVCSGCGPGGPPVGEVSGTVTLDGEPLPQAIVEFQPDQGAPSYGETAQDGTYELHYTTERMGALIGTHTVRITTAGEVTNEAGDTVNVRERVPKRYNSKSELSYEVTKGGNKIDIELLSK